MEWTYKNMECNCYWRKSKSGVAEVVILINGLKQFSWWGYIQILRISSSKFANLCIYAHNIKIIKRNWLKLQEDFFIEAVNQRFVETRNKLEETHKTDTGEVNLIQLPSQHHFSRQRITSKRFVEGWCINQPKRISSLNLVFIIDDTVHFATTVIVPWGREIHQAERFHCLVVACIYREQTTIKRPC